MGTGRNCSLSFLIAVSFVLSACNAVPQNQPSQSYITLHQKIEDNLNSGDLHKNAKVIRQVSELQRVCFSTMDSSNPLCFPDDQEKRYNEQRMEFAKKDAVCRKHLAAIKARKVVIGTPSRCALLALGSPDKVNSTRTAHSSSEQWVYSSIHYVYIRNGIVEGEQFSR
jgi:hypothetical protein